MQAANAEPFIADLAKKSDISFFDAISIHAGDIWNYSKGNNAFECRIGTELVAFPKSAGAMGLSTTYYYMGTLGNREEIQTYWIQGVTEGLWLNFSLPGKFELLLDQGVGLAVSKVSAVSILQKTMDNYYNSLLLSFKGMVYRPIFDVKGVAVCWNAGSEVRLFIEDDAQYANIGLIGGIMIKAGKR